MASTFGPRSCPSTRRFLSPALLPSAALESRSSWFFTIHDLNCHNIRSITSASTTPVARQPQSLSITHNKILPYPIGTISPSSSTPITISNNARSKVSICKFHSSKSRGSPSTAELKPTSPIDCEISPSHFKTCEEKIRKRSRRIVNLPQYRPSVVTITAATNIRFNTTLTRPSHIKLQELLDQSQNADDRTHLDKISSIYLSNWKSFNINDFSYILEMIQLTSMSQQEFWEQMTTLIRFSFPLINRTDERNFMEWRRTIAFAIMEVFWRQDQNTFIQQIKKLKTRVQPDIVIDHWGPFSSDEEILSHTMIDSLLNTFYKKKALQLYEALSEQGVCMRARIMKSFIATAVSDGDGQQIERIGEMLLRMEEDYNKKKSSRSLEDKRGNRPLIMSSKLMDSLVFGACNNGLYDLARAVFDKGLEANQHYRISTYTMILNSFSINGFGFDIAEAERAFMKQNTGRYSKKHRRESPNNHKANHIADSSMIEKYIEAMEIRNIQPTITTLNVIAKIYLEMSQHNVIGAPSWKYAFSRYNPLGLKPDVVTYNTLLAYLEKQKDLSRMKIIYNSMANTQVEVRSDKQQRQRKQMVSTTDNLDFDHVIPNLRISDQFEDPTSENASASFEQSSKEMIKPSERIVQTKQTINPYIRSNRDIYTYNTMLNALLRHAAGTKDITAIGQCFHDMELDGIPVDTVTFNTNVMYHIRRGDYDSAMQVFRSMDTKINQEVEFQQTKWTPNRQFSGLSSKPRKSKSSAAAKDLMDNSGTTRRSEEISSIQLVKSEPMPDVVTFTSLINGFAQSGDMRTATDLFMEMTRKSKVEPNLKTYRALAAGLHCIGDHESAEKLWDEVADDDDTWRNRISTWRTSTRNKEEKDSRAKLELNEEERLERQEQELWKDGEARGNLTVAEMRQVKLIREMYKNPHRLNDN